MINYCQNCSSPLIGDRCPNCPYAWVIWLFFMIVLGLTVQFCASKVHAEVPIPACAWTDKARSELGRMVQLETCSEDEYRTIGWALARRWRGRPAVRGLSFADSVTAFSHILRRQRDLMGAPLAVRVSGCSRRQRGILTSPVPAAVATRLEAWARGEVTDGCVNGRSWNWAAPPARRRRIRCPGYNRWRAQPAYVVLTEGHCG